MHKIDSLKMSGEIDLERLGQTSSNGEERKGVHDDDRQSQDVEKEQPSSSNLMYDIDTSPPWHLAVMLGFQVRSPLAPTIRPGTFCWQLVKML